MTTEFVTITKDQYGQSYASTVIHGIGYTAGPSYTHWGALEELRGRIELQMRLVEKEIQADALGNTAHDKLRLFSLGEIVDVIDTQLDRLLLTRKRPKVVKQ